MSEKQTILICGHRSFAARGLAEKLEDEGHTVHTFNRGPTGSREGKHFLGPVMDMAQHPGLAATYDCLINFIILKDADPDTNVGFVDHLLQFCESRKVKHLVHISSISVYAASRGVLREDSEVEQVPARKGSYGAFKVATENALRKNTPSTIELSLVRPGFILGTGLLNPIVGMGMKLPNNQVLVMGHAGKQFPLITRDQVHESLLRIVARNQGGNYQLVSSDSPNRKDYLSTACKEIGLGTGVRSAPVWLWKLAGLGGACAKYFIGMRHLAPTRIVKGLCERQTFDSSKTENELGVNFAMDWSTALREAMDQQVAPQRPYEPLEPTNWSAPTVNFIGYGAIVQQKHRPALKQLGYSDEIKAWDLAASTHEEGQAIEAVPDSFSGNGFWVVATPGAVHGDALARLEHVEGPIVIEKPLTYSMAELEAWAQFAEQRAEAVVICHNYRLKANVRKMMAHLGNFNPGALLHVQVNFQSPPVRNDSVTWRSQEREAKTLLMDYGLHFLDIACLFETSEWTPGEVDYELDGNGDTARIIGRLNSSHYPVDFQLRQGFFPRRARIDFTFQNYRCCLGFFPDTFTAHHANDNASLYKAEAKASARATRQKITDKLTGKDSDDSHIEIYRRALEGKEAAHSLSPAALAGFYKGMLTLAEKVYSHES